MQLRDVRTHKDMIAANEETFKLLCEAARKKDAKTIYKIFLERHARIDSKANLLLTESPTLVMQMAEEGLEDVVAFLMEEFGASVQDATEGRARAKNVEAVEATLLKLDVRNRAVRGYAFTGQVDRVNNLLDRGADASEAAHGYALAGNMPAVTGLFHAGKCKDDVVYCAVIGSAQGGFRANTEALIHSGARILDEHAAKNERLVDLMQPSHNPLKKLLKRKVDYVQVLSIEALGAYGEAGCFYDQEKMIRLLASTEDNFVFKHFIDFINSLKRDAYPRDFELSASQLTKKAAAIRTAMLDNKMSYDDVLTSGILNRVPEPKQRHGLFSLHRSRPAAAPAIVLNAEVVAPAEAVKVEQAAAAPQSDVETVVVKTESFVEAKDAEKSDAPRPN